MCEFCSATTSSPGSPSTRSAISFAIVAVGTKTASGWPSSSAAIGLEAVDGRVLAALLVPHLGRRDRGAHLLRRLRLGVGAEVDHQTPLGASTTPAAAGSADRSGCSSKQ